MIPGTVSCVCIVLRVVVCTHWIVHLGLSHPVLDRRDPYQYPYPVLVVELLGSY